MLKICVIYEIKEEFQGKPVNKCRGVLLHMTKKSCTKPSVSPEGAVRSLIN